MVTARTQAGTATTAPFRDMDAYWSQPAEHLFGTVHSAPGGLTGAEADRRLAEVGPNLLNVRSQVTLLGLFLNQFKSGIILILLFATLTSALLGDWVDAIIILVIVLSSAVLSLVQEYSANTAAEALRAQVKVSATVLRDGKPQAVPAENVVPGDVILLSAGTLIPADGVVLEAKDLFVSQAVLTGETFPVEKEPGVVPMQAGLSERTNSVFMGTNVRSGSGRALILETGTKTAFGQIAERLRLRPPETEFEHGIRHLGYLLTEVMFVLVFIVFAVNVLSQKPPLDSLLFSIALAVGLTPQLLPAIININLSRGSQTMAKQGVIVRRLNAIENFGSMNVLCTDKTGTLTEGVIKLDGALDGQGQQTDDVFRYSFLNAHFQTGMANPLDEAILNYKPLDVSDVSKIDEIPYDFIRKRLSVVVQQGNQRILIAKGALESILSVCVQPSTTDVQQRFEEWSGQGFRVLGVATRHVPDQPTYSRDDEHDMVFAGFLLFYDPPKAGVRDAIADLNSLGVQLKIITGDNHLVAKHTADSVGMPVTGILTGTDMSQMRDEALWRAVEQANLFTEVDPNQKERIILALKKMSYVVGYMGDGINDAPPLHAADVGVSVENAADVAKDAADFVLLKQDLSVLHNGIVQGRKTFTNTLKYIFMAVSANFGNMFSVAGASIFLPFLPMLPKQILLINFLTDFPEMTIAGDNVDAEAIRRPRRWDIGFIRRFMLVFGILSSFFDYLTFAALFFVLRAGEQERLFHTTWFVESVLSATLVVFVLRTRLPILRSRPSRLMLIATAAIGLITLYLPYSPVASLLEFQPLPLPYVLVVLVIVGSYVVCAELIKQWFYHWNEAHPPHRRHRS